jgi:polysaccharide biosynthesis protein PslH
MSRRISPRILYISEFSPYNEAIGSEVRARNVLRALQELGSVEVVILDGATQKCVEAAPGELNAASLVPVNQRRNKGFLEKLRWTIDPRSQYPNGCGADREAVGRILSSVHRFDLIWFFKLRSPDMFPTFSWRRSVVDIDDVPSTYHRAALLTTDATRARVLAARRLFTWERREKLLGERFNVLTVCSDGDKQYLHKLGVRAPIHVIPNGFEKPLTEPFRTPATPPRIGFIGLFEYFPNQEGIQWFVDNCWPSIKNKVTDARLRLVGRGSDGPLKPSGADIDGLGWLANPWDEIKTWSLMVVPIRLGAGTRVKIAQGFSYKCPIVSTTLGAYGYGEAEGQELLYCADSAKQFSEACVEALAEPEKAAQRAEVAWRHYLEKWTWDAIRPRVWAAAEECLQQSRNV